ATEVAAGHQREVLGKGQAQAGCDEQGEHSQVSEALQEAEDHFARVSLRRTYTPPRRAAREGFGALGGSAAQSTEGFPHPEQNLAPADSSAPQLEHFAAAGASACPQFEQNLPAPVCMPHLGQVTIEACVGVAPEP